MIQLTTPDGVEARIDGARVLRLRASYADEGETLTRTRIDWVDILFVREEAGLVAQKVAAEHPNLARLALPDSSPVGLDAKRRRPDPPPSGATLRPVKSAMLLGGKKQFLSSTPADVSAAIAAGGGNPLPIPADGVLATLSGYAARVKELASPAEVWK